LVLWVFHSVGFFDAATAGTAGRKRPLL